MQPFRPTAAWSDLWTEPVREVADANRRQRRGFDLTTIDHIACSVCYWAALDDVTPAPHTCDAMRDGFRPGIEVPGASGPREGCNYSAVLDELRRGPGTARELAERMGWEHRRVVKAIQYLHRRGGIKGEPTGIRRGVIANERIYRIQEGEK